MNILRAIQFVQAGRFPGPGGARNQHDPVVFFDDLSKHRRQAQFVQCRNVRGKSAHRDRASPVLLINIYAETGHVFDGVATIARTSGVEHFEQASIAVDNIGGEFLNQLGRREGIWAVDWKGAQSPVNVHERGLVFHKQ